MTTSGSSSIRLVISANTFDDASVTGINETFLYVGTTTLNCLLLENVWVKNFGKIYFSVLLLTIHTLYKKKLNRRKLVLKTPS